MIGTRPSADGKLSSCLIASTGFDLAEAMRAEGLEDEGLPRLAWKLWSQRVGRYLEIRWGGGTVPKLEMSFIGG